MRNGLGWLRPAKTLALVFMAGLLIGGLQAQTEGPLKVKIPPRRPPTLEPPAETREPIEQSDRPVLRREDPEEPSATDGACPEGYIAVRQSGDERPVLRRGGSSGASESETGSGEVKCYYSETLVDADGRVIEQRGSPPGTGAGDTFLERTRRAVFDYSSTLPDFVCDQLTTRYARSGGSGRWKIQDRIEAEVLYLDNKEEYRNIRRNGKAINSPKASGSWSTGEFGTMLLHLFHPQRQAEFTPAPASEIRGTRARVYSYLVKQENSSWRITYEGETIHPAFEGSVWVDPDTYRVLRLEMQAVEIPREFALDTIEATISYGPVRIGNDSYLLPLKSENLSCSRLSNNCTRNEIEFRGYRKFTAESTISTVDSDVRYESESAPPN